MASIRLIKRRIKSAKNISQVTKALQMVAAVKMRKAQEAATAGKPYWQELKSVLSKLSGKIDANSHPFLVRPEKIDKIMVVVIGPDKGLAGSLVTNLAKKVFNIEDQLKNGSINIDGQEDAVKLDAQQRTDAVIFGKKAQDIVKKTSWNIVADFTPKKGDVLAEAVRLLGEFMAGQYLAGKANLILIVYSDFINTVTQVPAVTQFLPMVAVGIAEKDHTNEQMTFEPSPQAVIGPLLQHYLQTVLRQIIFDSQASEHSARMVAMKNAYDNAKDIIKYLTLSYNQTRQSAITNEIADIVSGSLVSA